MTTYPQSKEEIGPHIWNTLHQISAQYPMEPTESDKLETKTIINGIVNRALPCKSCVDDSNERFKKLDYSNRKTLYETLCAQHNEINRRLKKPVVDCSTTLKLINECPTCEIPVTQKDDPVGLNVSELKRVYTDMINNMASEYGVPAPNISFEACPNDPRTSCLLFDNAKLVDGKYQGELPTMYINPYNGSPRAMFHEFRHQFQIYKGLPHTEDDANDFAFKKLNQYFPIKKDMKALTDTVAISADSGLANWRQNYPMYQQIENKTFGQAPPPNVVPMAAVPVAQPVDPNNDIVVQDDGIVKAFEGVARLPARWLGISPYDFVMTYVPETLTMTVKSVLGSNTTHFGNWFISLLGTLGLFTGSVLLNKSLAYGDRVLMSRITASMLSNVSDVSNPKIRDGIVSGFGTFMEGITSGDLDQIGESIIELPENSLISKWLNPDKGSKTELLSDSDALDSVNAMYPDPTDLSNPLRKVRNSRVGGGFSDGGSNNAIDSIYYGQNGGITDINSDSAYDLY